MFKVPNNLNKLCNIFENREMLLFMTWRYKNLKYYVDLSSEYYLSFLTNILQTNITSLNIKLRNKYS